MMVFLTPNFQMDVVKRFAKRIARLTLVPETFLSSGHKDLFQINNLKL